MRILVTGGCGFIGSALCRHLLETPDVELLNLDCLTYAANPLSMRGLEREPRYHLVVGDVADASIVRDAFEDFKPEAVIHMAAESHVDRSIDGADAFVRTNVNGTHVMLREASRWWRRLTEDGHAGFRFVHVSTDEVFGSLAEGEARFSEDSPYAPSSPYAASKAAADHLAMAWHRTYGLPVIITHCANNYGPRQFPEKLIPHMILRALHGLPLPVYGDGRQVRDWIHVEDHVRALSLILRKGRPGGRYLIGAETERTNMEVVLGLCAILDELRPSQAPHARLITHVADRPGHDRRYALDPTRLKRELGWRPRIDFDDGLRATVRWYLDNRDWWQHFLDSGYSLARIGTGEAGDAAAAGKETDGS